MFKYNWCLKKKDHLMKKGYDRHSSRSVKTRKGLNPKNKADSKRT